MKQSLYKAMLAAKQKQQKQFAVLIDPDKVTPESLLNTVEYAVKAHADYIFFGGSLLASDYFHESMDVVKNCCEIPVVIFPGSINQVDSRADAILYLSLLSGRNPDLLIGQQVAAAPVLKSSGLEVISTAYLLVDGGTATTVAYISNTLPIPYHKDDIAMTTAMAGEMLGFKLVYLDTGSGAAHSVSESMIARVSAHIEIPLLAGGGIKHPAQAAGLCAAGADIIVVGSAVEKDPSHMIALSQAVHQTVYEQ